MVGALLSVGLVQAVIVIIGLGRAKTLSVLLGPAAFGVVSTVDQVVLTVATLAAFSLPFTALKFMSRSHSSSEQAFARTFQVFVRCLAVLAVAAVIMSWLLLWIRPEVFGAALMRYRPLLYIATLGVPAVMLNILFINTLAAAQRTSESTLLGLVVALGLAAASIAGALVDDVRGLYVATVAMGVCTTAGSLMYLARTIHLGHSRERVDVVQQLRGDPDIVRFSMYIYVAASAYAVAMFATRYFVLSRISESAAGHLQAATSVALTVGTIVAQMNNLYLLPLVNRRTPQEAKTAQTNDFASKMILLLLLGSLPVAVFPRTVVVVLYSNAFVPAASVLFLFVVWQVLQNVVNCFMQLLLGLDDVLFWAASTCASYGLAVAMLPWLVSDFGLGGAALALVAGMLLNGVAAALRLRLKFSVGIARQVWIRVGVCVAAIAFAGMLFDPASEWTRSGIVLRTVYAIAVLAAGWQLVTSSERRWLIERIRRA